MKNSAIAKTVATPLQTKNAQIAEQFTALFDEAIGGVRKMIVFGAYTHQLAADLELQICNGGSHEGKTLKRWVEENTPHVPYNTAYAMYRMARGMCETLSIPVGIDIFMLITAPVDSLSKKEAKLRALIDESIAGKSARQLEWDFGIRHARAALPPAGGEREGSGRPKNSHTKEQIEIDALFSKDVLGKLGVAVLEKRWHLRLDAEKKKVLASIAMAIAEDLGDPTLRIAIKDARSRDLLEVPS